MDIIIVEDEKPSARKLQRMLAKLGEDCSVLLHSVEESIAWFKENEHPDLILLDIQLSDGLSFDIFEKVEIKSAIIFTTAYDEYALRAFKLNSIDYILKPIDPDELQLAIMKFKDRLPSNQIVQVDFNEIKKLLVNPIGRDYKKRFSIKIGQHLKLIDINSIECFFVQNKGTYIHTNEGRDYLIDESLEHLTNEINPELFFRVNRKFYLNIHAIKDIIAYSNSRLKIVLNSFDGEEVIVAREKVKDFKTWLDS